MKEVSIIIVSYNTRDLLQACLSAVFENTQYISFEVLVVDNGSSDGSVEMMRCFFPDVRIFLSDENLGFGRANNVAIQQASGKNIFFLNPDTILLNNAVKVLSDFLETHPLVGICGGNLYTRELTPAHSYMMYLPSIYGELDQLFFYRFSSRRYGMNFEFNHTGQPISVGYITGADLMIRKEILDVVGGFDPDFFMYFEETELTWRVRHAGFQVMSVPEARIIHLEGQSFILKEQRERLYLTSRRFYLQKVYPCVLSRWVCNFLYMMTVCVRIVYYFYYRKNEIQALIWKYRLRHF